MEVWALGRVVIGVEGRLGRKGRVSISRNGEENSALENTSLVITSLGVFAVAGRGRNIPCRRMIVAKTTELKHLPMTLRMAELPVQLNSSLLHVLSLLVTEGATYTQ